MQEMTVLASNCHTFPDKSRVHSIMQTLQPVEGTLHGPYIIERDTGIVGVLITQKSVYILTVHTSERSVLLEVRSSRKHDTYKYMDLLKPFTDVHNLARSENEGFTRMECQEPRCTRTAVHDINGFKLCQDHHELWLEKSEKENYMDRYR